MQRQNEAIITSLKQTLAHVNSIERIWTHSHSLESDEKTLISNQVRVNVAFAQLVTTIDATCEDEKNRGAQECEEDAHSCSQGGCRLLAGISNQIIDKKNAEEEQAPDLEA